MKTNKIKALREYLNYLEQQKFKKLQCKAHCINHPIHPCRRCKLDCWLPF
jgi:hypothetical protein